MKLARFLAVFGVVSTCPAQLPDFYKNVNRVTWVVENIDKVKPAWEALGLSDVRKYPNIQLNGHFRGTPITIYAWQVTGRLGNLTVEMIQPGEGQNNAYTNFLAAHGDGILSMVHEVPSKQAMDAEIQRMKAKGVGVLQQVTMAAGGAPVTYTYFDTEQQGKFVLGLVHRQGGMGAAQGKAMVSHFATIIRDGAAVSAYWAKLGFPAFPMTQTVLRGDSRYPEKPLALTFEAGFQRHAQFPYEWIAPPAKPSNPYADFLIRHRREGIQHIGIEVEDMEKSVEAHEKMGYRVRQAGVSGEPGKPNSARYVYMNTESAGGISVELVRRY